MTAATGLRSNRRACHAEHLRQAHERGQAPRRKELRWLINRFNETEDCTEGFKPKYRIIEQWDLVGVVPRHPVGRVDVDPVDGANVHEIAQPGQSWTNEVRLCLLPFWDLPFLPGPALDRVRSCGTETWLAIGLVLIRGDIVYPRASVTAYHVIAALQFISELLGIIRHLRYSPHNLGANRSRPHRRESWRMRSAQIRFLYSASDRSRCAAADASAPLFPS
jgi:hypothetical protein